MKITRTVIVAWLSALAYFGLSFFDARTPGSVGLLAWIVAWPLHRIIVLVAGVALLRSWRESGVLTLLAIVACCAASMAGSTLGLNARDRRFFEWRLPVYRSVIDRIGKTVDLPDFDRKRHAIELMGAECDAAKSAFAWLDQGGQLVVQFVWAGGGPPPKHFLYTYVAAGARSESEVWGSNSRRMGDFWYESFD